jgi:hypothetical protein
MVVAITRIGFGAAVQIGIAAELQKFSRPNRRGLSFEIIAQLNARGRWAAGP